MMIAYPVFSAAHLVYQTVHYPGARDKIWGTDFYEEAYRTPAQDLEYAYAVRAAARVFTMGLAFNIAFLMGLDGRERWRSAIGVASGWVFLALQFASWDSGWGYLFFWNMFSVIWVADVLICLSLFLTLGMFPLVAIYQYKSVIR